MTESDESDRRTLGVSLDADQAVVKIAYKRAALRLHPDKINGNNNAFVELHHAYRRIIARLDEAARPDGKYIVPQTCLIAIRLIATWLAAQAAAGPPETLHVDIVITLEDLYDARVKKVILGVHRRFGASLHRRKLLLRLLKFTSTNTNIFTYPKMGDQAAHPGLPDGDVQVSVSVAPHPSGMHMDDVLNRFDLHLTVPTTMTDFLYGRDVLVTDVPGGDICVRYGGGEEGDTPQSCTVLRGRGLPHSDDNGSTVVRGDLYVFFSMLAPRTPSIAVLGNPAAREMASMMSNEGGRGGSFFYTSTP